MAWLLDGRYAGGEACVYVGVWGTCTRYCRRRTEKLLYSAYSSCHSRARRHRGDVRGNVGHGHTRDDPPRARTCMKYAAKMYPNTAAAHNRYLVDSAPLTTLRSV